MVGMFRILGNSIINQKDFFRSVSKKSGFVDDFLKPFFINWGAALFTSIFAIFTYLFWVFFPIMISGIIGAFSKKEMIEMIVIGHIPFIFVVGLSPLFFLLFASFVAVLFLTFNVRKNIFRNTFKVLGYSSLISAFYGVLLLVIGGLLEYGVPKFDLFSLDRLLSILLIVVVIGYVIHLFCFIIDGMSRLNDISRLKSGLIFIFSIFLFVLFLIMVAISIISIILLIGVFFEHLERYL